MQDAEFLPPEAAQFLRALAVTLLALQVVASQVVARLPKRVLHGPWGTFWGAVHRFGHARFYNEFGTVKMPGAPVVDTRPGARAIRAAYETWRNSFDHSAPAWEELEHRDRIGWAFVVQAGADPDSLQWMLDPPAGVPPGSRPLPEVPSGDRPTIAPRGVVKLVRMLVQDSRLGILTAAMFAAVAATNVNCSGGATRGMVRGLPPVSSCAPRAVRCGPGGAPEVCSPEGAWWSALPRRPDGTDRSCPDGSACAVDDGGAYCAPTDAAADAAADAGGEP